jgi:hypothetical protein
MYSLKKKQTTTTKIGIYCGRTHPQAGRGKDDEDETPLDQPRYAR